MGATRVLRPRTEPVVESVPTVVTLPDPPSAKMLMLMELATELGVVILSKEKLLIDFAQQIVSHMVSRSGTFVYQSAAFNYPNFPLTVATEMMPSNLLVTDTESAKTWLFADENFDELVAFMSMLFSTQGKMSFGLTHALQTDSEKVVRSMATMMTPVEISWVGLTRGVDRLYLNFNYVLWDQWGGLHPPKDMKRREILISDEISTKLRQQVIVDALSMTEAGAVLSPAWLRQLAMDQEAALLECELEAKAALPPPPKGKRRAKQATYEAAAILEERGRGRNVEVLVAWAGYDPRWERGWRRATGEPGTLPFTTWEWRSTLETPKLKVEALIAWDQRF